MKAFDIVAESRLLLLAPHPDDEALAMGGLLQRAAAVGAVVFVAFLTDGENNPWPQRAADRRWSIGPQERARWGARRRSEALRSMRALGLGPERATFLGFPDQRLTRLVVDGDPTLTRALRELLDEREPTHVVSPSAQDHHPDHSAIAVALRSTLAGSRRHAAVRLFEYVVHDRSQRPAGAVVRVRLGHDEIARKRRAIACHASQLIFRRRELLAYATPGETFHEIAAPGADEPHHPIPGIDVSGDRLLIRLRRRPCARAFGPVTLQLLFPALTGLRRVMSVALPWRSGTVPLRFADGRAYPHVAEYRGGPYRGVLSVPVAPLPRLVPGYVKLESRFGFFDEAGWRTLPVLSVRGSRRALVSALREALAGRARG
jgi:LmbE family N-acetylglucosaminyl deacetylase